MPDPFQMPYPLLHSFQDAEEDFTAVQAELTTDRDAIDTLSADLQAIALDLISAGIPNTIQSGSGAPTTSPLTTQFYFRTDTPTVANQRLYVFDPVGATWTGIL